MLELGWGRDLLIFLAIAGIVVPIFGRLRFGVVPGFLIAGIALGPGGLGHLAGELPWLRFVTFTDPERVRPFAELGVVFLLFVIGLEFSFGRLWAMRRSVLGVGSIQVLASALLIMAISLALGAGPALAVVVGLALAMSSTAIVTQVLLDLRRFARPAGQVSVGVLLFQDLTVVPIVIIVEMLGGREAATAGAVVEAIAIAVAVVAGILLVGRYLTAPLLRIAAGTGNRDLVTPSRCSSPSAPRWSPRRPGFRPRWGRSSPAFFSARANTGTSSRWMSSRSRGCCSASSS
jgi:CPA2 family monovalent cation:H+ antiporter-2